jgi:hypothetical protein
MSRGDGELKSYFLTKRDPSSCWGRFASQISNNLLLIITIAYMWYVSWKPVIMFILSAVFTGLSIVLIYADVSYCFGAKNNIIYNLVT